MIRVTVDYARWAFTVRLGREPENGPEWAETNLCSDTAILPDLDDVPVAGHITLRAPENRT